MIKGHIIVGLGEILWDVLPHGKQLGGAPANFAYHASQFSLEGRAVSAIGNDALGREILSTLDARGMRYLIETVNFPTGTVDVTLDNQGVPCYDIKQGAAWDNMPFTPALEATARDTAAVCFGSLAQRSEQSRSTIQKFLEAMPQGDDSYRIFDINLRQTYYNKQVIHDSLCRSNILKINDEEAGIVGPLFDMEGKSMQNVCCQLMANYHLKMVILTCGTAGSYVFTPNEESFLPTPTVKVADTVGAGDSFTAAFVASLIKGKSIHQAHHKAVAVSAYVCTQNGAMPTLPNELKEHRSFI